MEFTAQLIADHLGGIVEGDPDVKVSDISKIEEGRPGTLSFLANPKYEKYLYDSESSIILINKDFSLTKPVKATLVRVDDAYKSFASLLEMYQQNMPQKSGVDEKVVIDESAMVGEGCYIGAFTVISKNALIGNNVKIYPQVFIDENVVVEDNTILYSGVKIYKDCKVGKNCIIHSSTVIGSDGFGFAPQEDGTYKKIPQLGNVVIEDDVEIGSNVSVDCATMGSTIIRKGTKLDNLIQIAHNVEVGQNCVFAAHAGVAGSAKIGNNCMVGGQVGIIGHIKVGNRVKIVAQSGITGNVKDDEVLLGSPAVPITLGKRIAIAQKSLPEMHKKLRTLEKAVEELKQQLNPEG